MYADAEYYKNIFRGVTVPDAELDSYLQQASDSIDQATYCRINGKGFENLTAFQQSQVKMATCHQAEYLYNMGDIIDTAQSLQGYNVGGNSVSIKQVSPYSVKALNSLKSTGLLYRGL